jgi:hypothetical protein
MKTLDYKSPLWALALCGVALPIFAQSNAEKWLPLNNSSIEPIAGSALDLSALSQRRDPANKTKIELKINGENFETTGNTHHPVRFFTATLGLSPNHGGFPDHATADRLAIMIKRGGYNAVRVHMVEAMLMSNRHRDFDFEPDQLDRFYYLMNALRLQGMYFFVDMLGSWNGAYGDVVSHRWTRGQHDVTLGSLISDKERAHWLELVNTLWMRKNPYSGMATLTDPAVAGVILINEGSVDFLLRSEQRSEFISPFRSWLLKKYVTDQAVMSALGKLPIEIHPPPVSEKSNLSMEFQLFTNELQSAQLGWMRTQLRELGFTGAVTAFNDWPGYHAAASRTTLSFVDMHQYADHPTGGMTEPGTKLWLGSVLDGRNRFLDKLAWSRHIGQPFSVTEFGQPFWNPKRWEVAPFTSAYARLQGWSQIAHYGNTFSVTRPALGKWRAMMVPFEVSTDPTLRAGETIAAFLYGRGDVTQSKERLVIKVDSKEAAGMPADRFVSWQLAQMQYVLGVGLQFQSSAATDTETKSKILTITTTEDNLATHQIFNRLQDTQVIAKDTWTNPSLGRYQSSTGELRINLKQKTMTVATKGSVGVLGGSGSMIESAQVSIRIDEGDGAVFVADLGIGDLSQSKRALLIVSTDSRNTGMTFLDTAETVLNQLGTFPANIKDATVTILMPASKDNKNWKLFLLNLMGERLKELPLEKLTDSHTKAIVRLSSLGKEVTPYFEWVAE